MVPDYVPADDDDEGQGGNGGRKREQTYRQEGEDWYNSQVSRDRSW
jgi:uncharacterized sporulation protein YeaH/YhbH (DUF444 family)